MLRKKSTFKKLVIISLSIVFLLQSSVAFAGGYRRPRGGQHYYHQRYGPRAGYCLAPIFGGFTALYYLSLAQQRAKAPTYVVVPAASTTTFVVPSPGAVELSNEAIIYIPNTDGSYTQVKLSKSGNGYIGPQREYYPEHPTVNQLKALYGK